VGIPAGFSVRATSPNFLAFSRPPTFKIISMQPLTLTLLLCGLILLLNYLVFLLPTERKIYSTRQAFERSMSRSRECMRRCAEIRNSDGPHLHRVEPV
jgi:hypothetical protein